MKMNNKHFFLLAALILLLSPAMAQNHKHKDDGPRREISEMVSDLSQSQKKRLDAISDESKTRVSALRAQQKAVRDSISMYINMDGDHTKEVFPLFDREANIQRAISREMYTTKVRIDEVLTPKQRKQLSQCKAKNKLDKPKSETKKSKQ